MGLLAGIDDRRYCNFLIAKITKMAKKIQCDICEKDTNQENAYELKLRKNDSGLTKNCDVCHNCAKAPLEMLSRRDWKKWNQKQGKWLIPE